MKSKFTKTIIINLIKLVHCNTFGPLIIYQGETILFDIPDDLFHDFDGDKLTLDAYLISWSSLDKIIFKIPSNSLNDTKSVFVSSNFPMEWNATISAIDPFNQTAELTFEVKVNNCSSKLWSKCHGIYEKDWFEWVTNFELQASGAWLFSGGNISTNNFDFYNIAGLIVLITLIIQIMLVFKLGKHSFKPLVNIQSILLFTFSINHEPSSALLHFFSWLQVSKLDLDFLDFPNYRSSNWRASSYPYQLLNFPCHSPLLNYFIPCILMLLCLLALLILFVLFRPIYSLWVQYWNGSIKLIVQFVYFRLFLPPLILCLFSSPPFLLLLLPIGLSLVYLPWSLSSAIYLLSLASLTWVFLQQFKEFAATAYLALLWADCYKQFGLKYSDLKSGVKIMRN